MQHTYRHQKNTMNETVQAVKGEKNLQEALKVSDEQLLKYYEYASELYERENYAEASDIFFFLTQLNPLLTHFWMAFASSEWMNNNFDEAFSAFQMAIALSPTEPQGYILLAKCCVANDQREAALDYLNLMETSCEPSQELTTALEYKKTL